MREVDQVLLGGALVLLLAGAADICAKEPPAKPKEKPKNSQGPPDEEREILKEIKEAYKAPFEVHEDVLKEIRRAYQQPTPERENKIFKELRRLYQLAPQQETAILAEIR